VISRQLSAEHLESVGKVLRRPPLIWDNLHANDYDSKRLFLGPYAGRPVAIKQLVTGVLLNPNCEFEANFVPMHTLGQWCRCLGGDARSSTDSDQPPTLVPSVEEAVRRRTLSAEEHATVVRQGNYHPLVALAAALDAWVPEVAEPTVAFATPRLPPLPPPPDFVVEALQSLSGDRSSGCRTDVQYFLNVPFVSARATKTS